MAAKICALFSKSIKFRPTNASPSTGSANILTGHPILTFQTFIPKKPWEFGGLIQRLARSKGQIHPDAITSKTTGFFVAVANLV